MLLVHVWPISLVVAPCRPHASALRRFGAPLGAAGRYAVVRKRCTVRWR